MIEKRSLILLILILSSIVCDTTMKIKTLKTLKNHLTSKKANSKSSTRSRNQVKTKTKTQSQSQKTNKASTNNTSTVIQSSTCVDKGMGFKGIALKKLFDVQQKLKGKNPKTEEFNKYIQPLLTKAGSIVTSFFDFAVGDFTGKDLGTMDNLLCDVVPLEEDSTFGTIAVKLSNLPCGKPTSVTACFTFSQCGSFTLAFNGGLLGCAVSTTGIGQIVAPFLDAIEHVGIGFSVNNRILQTVTIYTYDASNESFTSGEVTAKGNLFFTLGVSVADIIFPDSVKVGEKTLGEIFEIKGLMNVIVDFGKTFSNLAGVIKSARGGTKVKFMALIKSFLQSGAEFALAIKASISFKLADLSKNFLPDLELASAEFNMLATLGGGNTGVAKGVYLRLNVQLTFIQSFYDGFRNSIGKIIEFFGYKLPEQDLSIKVEVGIAIQADVVGIILKGNFADKRGDLTCIYRYSDDRLSCNGWSLNPFTIIKDGVQWVVKKAEKFFQMVGNEIRVAFDDFGKKIITNIIEPANRFFKGEGKLPSYCPPGQENSVGLCYPVCRAGYYGTMTMCIPYCPSGYRNDGLYCFKPSPYGRGGGYVIWDGPKCNRENSSVGCEQWGAMWYPRCRSGFYNFGCCICTPTCPPGMTDIGISCQKPTYDRGVGKIPTCQKDEDYIAGLCYKKKYNYDYSANYQQRKNSN